MSVYEQKIKEGIALLFENYWILRSEKPKEYLFLRNIEKSLRKEISDRFAYQVYFTRDFIKLEKLPVIPQSWMGIAAFVTPLDYSLFSCFLYFLEERDANSYFLLQQICEELKELYPFDPGLNWVNRDHRRSLIRVIQVAIDHNLIESIDGELERFSQSESAEVLYVSTSFSRHFMRPYPQNIHELQGWKGLLESDALYDHEANRVRHTVYRRLFLEPSVMESSLSTQEFFYIRNQRGSIEDFLDKYTDFHLGIYQNFAYLGSEEPNNKLMMFPSAKSIDSIILHLATLIREMNIKTDESAVIQMDYEEFNFLVETLHKKYSYGWSKTYREHSSTQELSASILEQASAWGFLEFDDVSVRLLPTLALYEGAYPPDFTEKEVS